MSSGSLGSPDWASAAPPAAAPGPPPAGRPATPIRLAAIGIFATDGALLLLGILTGSLVARWLQPEGRGALAAVLFWPQLIATIGLLSLNEAVTFRVGERPARSSSVTRAAVRIALVLSALVMMAGYAVLPYLLGPERTHLVGLSRAYLLIFVPFNFLGLCLLSVDHGRLRFGRYNLLRLLLPPLYLAGLVFFWAIGSFTVTHVVAAGLGAAVAVSGLRIILQRHAFAGRGSWRDARSLLQMALGFHPATVLLLLSAQADQLAVLMLWDDAAVGHYMVALTLASALLGVIGGAFQRVLFPHLVQPGERIHKVRLLARAVRYFMLLLILVAVPLALLMPWLVPFLVGQAFRGAVGVAQLLLLACIVVTLKSLLIQGLRGLGDGRSGMTAAAISLGVFGLVFAPLGQVAGLQGIAAALALSNAAALLYLSMHLRKRYHLTWRELWGLDRRSVREAHELVRHLVGSVLAHRDA